MKPLLIGGAEPGRHPAYALNPWPVGSAGHRLCFDVLGLDSLRYKAAFNRVNLCPDEWDLDFARGQAVYLRSVPAFQAVLLGRNAAEAFRMEEHAPFTLHRYPGSLGWVVLLPHPAEVEDWDERGAFDKARALVQSVYPYDLLF